jgi:aminopeptidase N
LYNVDKNDALVVGDVLPVQIVGARTEVAVPEGRPCPVIVNPNFHDWAYARITLSDSAAEVLREQLGDVADPLSRSIFLAALFDRAMAGDMPIADYVDQALRLAGDEKNLRVLEQITNSIVEAVDLMQRLRPETDEALARLLREIEGLSLRRAQFAETQDLKHMWLNTFLGVVASRAGLGTARALLDGEADIAGVEISPEIRWRLLTILSRNAAVGIAELLEAEEGLDPSDFGTRSLLSTRAALPLESVKAHWLNELQKPESVTGLARQRAVMAELFPSNQTALQLQFLDQILEAMPALSLHGDPYFLSSYARELLTPMCRAESTALMQAALDDYTEQLDATTLRFLREAHQADSECQSLRAMQLR